MHGFRCSPDALTDVQSGLVDPRVMARLERLSRDHEFSVRLIRTGHPMGPISPAGRDNAHYFYRAVDIDSVGEIDVSVRPLAPPVVALGRTLVALDTDRPDSVMGPTDWHAALSEGDRRVSATTSRPTRDTLIICTSASIRSSDLAN